MYHILARGVARMDTFLDLEDRRVFLELLGSLAEKGSLIIHAFCLMLNHIHILVETPAGELGRWMQVLLGRYAQNFNKRHNRVGHLWQGRYKSILIEEGDYFLNCSRYIHLNPYRSKMVPCFQCYPWSSYSNFLGGPCLVEWVNIEKTLRYFCSAGEYRAFVESGEETINPLQEASGGVAFGSEAFVDRVRMLLRRSSHKQADAILRSLRRGATPPTTKDVQLTIEKMFRDYSECQRRRILMYILRSITTMTVEEIAAIVCRTPSAVSHVTRVMQSRMLKESGLASKIDDVGKMYRT
jgi:putative transposase